VPSSFFDTNILVYIASALHPGYDILWSDDMLDGLILNEGLRISDPFRMAV
jgi:predicted nucleic acid-binding protein